MQQGPPPPAPAPAPGAPPPGAAPPGQPPPKKGLSTLAWVGIGCGGLLVVACVATGILAAMGVSWLGNQADEMQKNPAMASAKLAVKMNPELELVDADDGAGTVTIKNKESGEVVTVSLDEVNQGHIQFTGPKGQKVDMNTQAGPGGAGRITVKTDGGEMHIGAGAGAPADLPSWVPRYPNGQITSSYTQKADGKQGGSITFQTKDSVDDVVAWFKAQAGKQGLDMSVRRTMQVQGKGGGRTEFLGARGKGREMTFMVGGNAEEGTQAVLGFSGPP